MTRYLNALLVSLALLAPATAQAANFVVVEARGIALRAGQILDSMKRIKLSAGQHLTLITSRAATLKLDGPYDKAPDLDASQGVSWSDLVRKKRGGGVRPASSKDTPLPDPWLLEVGQPAPVCLMEGSTAVLWRPKSATNSTLSIMPSDKSWKAQTVWPAGADRVALTADVPVRAGSTYAILLDGAQSSLTLETVPAVLQNDQMRAEWMIQKGCISQAQVLLARDA